ncbi:MAG: osmotically-inducible protein OsmY [Halieaceae bacterium]|jgi:osmotically-inducible protein OsmY
MKTISLLSFLALTLLLQTGCNSIIAVSSPGPIPENYAARTWGGVLDDEGIETKSYVNIKQSDEGFKKAHIVVVCYNGSVLLTGQVPNNELRNKAPEVVRKIQKVKRIYNELSVAGNTSPIVRSNDAWITAKIKTALFASPQVEGYRTKVVTEHGVVYLMGLANRAEAARIVEVASSSYGVQKVVQLFDLVD